MIEQTNNKINNNLICGLCKTPFDTNETLHYAKNLGNMTKSVQVKKNTFNSGCSHPFHNTIEKPCFEKISLMAHGTDPFCNICISPKASSTQDSSRKISQVKNKTLREKISSLLKKPTTSTPDKKNSPGQEKQDFIVQKKTPQSDDSLSNLSSKQHPSVINLFENPPVQQTIVSNSISVIPAINQENSQTRRLEILMGVVAIIALFILLKTTEVNVNVWNKS